MTESPSTRPSLLVRIRDPLDERAWAEFLEIYTPLIYRLARAKGFQDADAADLVQDVFRSVARAIDRWDPDPRRGSFRGWLFRIARNLMIDLLASQRRHPRGTGDTGFERFLQEQPAADGAESALFDEEYRRQLFGWAVEQVRCEFREPTWQSFWRTGVEGKDPREVAQSLGISVGAVYHNKSRVTARIRQRIEHAEGET